MDWGYAVQNISGLDGDQFRLVERGARDVKSLLVRVVKRVDAEVDRQGNKKGKAAATT